MIHPMRLKARRWPAGLGAAAALLASAMAVAAPAPDKALPGAPDAEAAASTRIVTLGTLGGPVTSAERSESASLIQVGDRVYLVDAGDGVSHRLAVAGFSPAQVSKVFLTHLHFDHVGGLAPLIGFAWISLQSQGIDIYGPPGTAAFVDGAKTYLQIPERIFAAQLPPTPSIGDLVTAHEVDLAAPTEIFRDDRVRVTAVANSHFDAMPGKVRPTGAKRSYSYRFDTPDRAIVFTGDTGPSEAVVALAKGADVLVSEVIDVEQVMAIMRTRPGVTEANVTAIADHMYREHLTPEQVGQMAARAGVKMVILNHVSPVSAGQTDFRRFSDGVRRTFAGPVVVSQDGGEY